MFSKIKHEVKLGRELSVFFKRGHKDIMREAGEIITAIESLSDQEKAQYLRLYKKDYRKTRSNFQEWYYQYRMYGLSDREKKSFLSIMDLKAISKKYELIFPDQRPTTRNKELFLRKYAAFVHRKWMVVTENSNPEEIDHFIAENDTIVKPLISSQGKAIIKIKKGTKNASEIVLSRQLPVILEECVVNCRELAAFHESSLNTIRLVTLSNGSDVRILGCALRTGNNGNICDNANAGGLYAAIDPDSGIVLSNGFFKLGEEVREHPKSRMVFKGFRIPMWKEVRTVCTQAALFNKQSMMIGWDIAVTTNGVELIEGNSHPGLTTLQMPLHKGIRGKFFAIMRELCLPYRDVLIWTWLIGKAIDIKTTFNHGKRPFDPNII